MKEKCAERVHLQSRSGCMITPFVLSVYADDFVITSLKDRIPNRFIKEAIRVIEEDGTLEINRKKIRRTSLKHRSHKITGITFDRTYYRGRYWQNWIALPRKTRKSYRNLIFRATMILKNGRLPDKEKDGISVNQIFGVITRVKDVYRGQNLPPDLRISIENFEALLVSFQKEFGIKPCNPEVLPSQDEISGQPLL